MNTGNSLDKHNYSWTKWIHNRNENELFSPKIHKPQNFTWVSEAHISGAGPTDFGNTEIWSS
jgi:hypothetical protein